MTFALFPPENLVTKCTSYLIGSKDLWLPSYSEISNSEIDEVCYFINEYFDNSWAL